MSQGRPRSWVLIAAGLLGVAALIWLFTGAEPPPNGPGVAAELAPPADAKGLDDPPVAADGVLPAQRPPVSDETERGDPGGPEEPGTLVLTVVGPAGAVPNAPLSVWRHEGGRWQARADEHGEATLEQLLPGHYRVSAHPKGLASSKLYEPILSAGETKQVELMVAAGWPLSGRVVMERADCAMGGEVPPRLRLTAVRRLRIREGELGVEVFVIDIGERGEFRDTLRPGEYDLVARTGPGVAPLIASASIALDEAVSGLCMVLAAPWERPETDEQLAAACKLPDEDFKGLPPHPCRIPNEEELACSIAGRVLTRKGEPVASAEVMVTTEVEDDCPDGFFGRWVRMPPEINPIRFGVTDQDGRFDVHLLACTGTVVIVQTMLDRYACGVASAVLDSGNTTAVVEVVLDEVGG